MTNPKLADELTALAWECFSDAAYYDMWCVRQIGERTFGQGFHLVNGDEAKALCDMLNARSDGWRDNIQVSAALDILHDDDLPTPGAVHLTNRQRLSLLELVYQALLTPPETTT